MDKLESGQMIEWDDLDKKRYYVIGPSLFICVRALIYPFNLIKTRLFMQQQKTVYSGTLDAFSKIVRHEGIVGLYRGFVASSLGLVSGQLYITSYEVLRRSLRGYSTEMKGMLAGGGATLVAQTVTVPVDIVSQHMMMQGQVNKPRARSYVVVKNADYIVPKKPRLRGAMAVIRGIIQKEGVHGLYRGYTVSLLTYAPNSSLWWMFYSSFYRRSVERGATELLPIPLVQACCGVSSAVLSATLTNPMDAIRTRYQLEETQSIKATIHKFWREEGIRGLKKGLSARIISSTSTSAILVVSYEWVKRMSLRTDT